MIILGDCLEEMKDIPDNSIDMILTDLPYGTTSCKWDSIIPLDKLWVEWNRIIKPNTPIILTSQTPFDKILGMSNIKNLRYEWIWEKNISTGHMNANKMPLKSHENILVFYEHLPIYNPQFTEGKPYTLKRNKGKFKDVYGITGRKDGYISINSGKRHPRTVVKFNRCIGLHPTQKPVSLFEYLIKTYSNEGDTVLDCCAGSGTTGVACKNLNRNYILIEKDEGYYNIIKERLK
tara:strand:+ start:42 stop:743 length:702 start_codon:yes stop_codon:yes gene_type:complete